MQLSTTEHEQLYAILQQYDENPQVQRMREFIQHGDVTTYQHCKNVVRVSFWLNRRLHLHADETSLAVGAFLHDFYLYDWHKRSTFHGLRRLFEMHGFSHPGYACVNAQRVFHITKKEQDIIASHMWPLTFRHVPTSIAPWWKACSAAAAWPPPAAPTVRTPRGDRILTHTAKSLPLAVARTGLVGSARTLHPVLRLCMPHTYPACKTDINRAAKMHYNGGVKRVYV